MKKLKKFIIGFSLVSALLVTGCSDGSGGTESGSQNADVMAQAVRTLLEKDK